MKVDWKGKLKAAYEFIFVEDGPLSIAAFCVVAYVGIRFVFFPLVGLVTGTSLPIVAVISDSMIHGDSWESNPAFCGGTPCNQTAFYRDYNISQDRFATFPFNDGFQKGDVMLVRGKDTYEVGDVIVYEARGRPPVIHRIINDSGDTFTVKGDNNPRPIPEIGEFNLAEERIIGSAYARIPFIGWVKLGLVKTLRILQGEEEIKIS